MKKWIAGLLAMTLLLSGCGGASADLTEGYIPRKVEPAAAAYDGAADFAVELFRHSVTEGENTLISPLSVLNALAMTVNGAEGETLAQMEAVLGASRETLNEWCYRYRKELAQQDMLHLANGIWFSTHPRFAVSEAFLQTNADYFDAGIFAAPFDQSTLTDINNWVADRTHGMIRHILSEIPDGAVMYLVNALAFEAEWVNIYEKDQVREAVFTTEDGRAQEAELMYSSEYRYLEHEKATGFMRYYRGNDYAFVALLPREGVSVSQLVESLDGASLTAMLAQPQTIPVETAIPKFEAESSLDMNNILMDMGMTETFDPETADLTGLGTSAAGNIYIDRVLHKTFISVAEKGTRAGAVTVVEANDRAMAVETDSKEVYLDRPFVYMIVDCSENLPFFMGTCMEIGS